MSWPLIPVPDCLNFSVWPSSLFRHIVFAMGIERSQWFGRLSVPHPYPPCLIIFSPSSVMGPKWLNLMAVLFKLPIDGSWFNYHHTLPISPDGPRQGPTLLHSDMVYKWNSYSIISQPVNNAASISIDSRLLCFCNHIDSNSLFLLGFNGFTNCSGHQTFIIDVAVNSSGIILNLGQVIFCINDDSFRPERHRS